LWTDYSPDLMRRQLTRFFCGLLSPCYWPERGGDLRATINWWVPGAGGGRWHVLINPQGGDAGEGWAKAETVTIWARNANALCRLFTLQVSPLRAALTGTMLAWGNVPLAFRLLRLFRPT
jgi:hypothetical protein